MVETAAVLTKQGLAKIAEATAEKPFKLEKFAVGDGNGKPITPTEDFTKLAGEKYRDYLNSKYAEDNDIVVECVLRANAPIAEGFTIRELGIFDDAGTLIAVAKTPESYRPSNKEGVATETIYSIVLKIENTNNITISLKEGLFATQDALNREIQDRTTADTSLDNKITTNKTTIEALQTQVKDLINTLNKYHDRRIGTIFYYGSDNPPEGALKCDGRFVEIAKYPKLFNVIGHQFNGGAVDPKDGTFALPDALNIYLRGASKDKRVGFYEEDAIKKHGHDASHGHTNEPHIHKLNRLTGGISRIMSFGAPLVTSGIFRVTWNSRTNGDGYGGPGDPMWYNDVALNSIESDTSAVVINDFKGYTSEEGAEETRVNGVIVLTCIWYE